MLGKFPTLSTQVGNTKTILINSLQSVKSNILVDNVSRILGMFVGGLLSASIGGGFLSGGLHAITGDMHVINCT